MARIDFGRRFREFEEQYRRPDGSRWRNRDIEEATGRFVSGNYVTNLKKGRYKNPGHDRLLAIANVMGFPAEFWYHEEDHKPAAGDGMDVDGESTLASKLEFLIGSRNDPRTGEPLDQEAVSQLTSGVVSVQEIDAALNGRCESLQSSQYRALSEVFGVDVAFWYKGYGHVPALEADTVESLRDREAEEVLNKFHRLERPEDRNLIRSLLDRFATRGE